VHASPSSRSSGPREAGAPGAARPAPVAGLFVAGAAVMALEILAPRRLAPLLGTSTPVWTAALAVVLVGLAAGNLLGGWLSDRGGGRRLEAVLLLLAAVALVAAPVTGPPVARATRAWPLVGRTLAAMAAAAFVPTVLLGAVYPVVARRAMAQGTPSRVLGRLAAAGAAGSLVGTFVTSYVLIPHLGVSTSLAVVGAPLVAVALFTLRPSALRAARTDFGAGTPPFEPALGAPRWSLPHLLLLAVVTGAATLGLEIVAARRTAIDAGPSLDAWTAVFAVVLAGLSVGGLLGGRLASGPDPRRALGSVFLAASLLVGVSLWAGATIHGAIVRLAGPFAVRVAFGVALAYAPAFLALGTIPPILARLALSGDATSGRTVGAVSAAGTVGALAASLATGPWILGLLRLEGTTAALAATLAIAAATGGGRLRAGVGLAGAGALVALVATLDVAAVRVVGLALGLRPDPEGAWVCDSPYARVVLDEPPEGPGSGRRLRQLRADARREGLDDMDDPTWMGSNYARFFATAVERVGGDGAAPRVLFLGGGSCSAPRAVLAWRPKAVVDVAEIDAAMDRGTCEVLGARFVAGLRISHQDARTFVAGLAADAAPYDLVFADAFGTLGVPWHLTTIEFLREVRARMSPDGVYLVNLIDVYASGRFVSAFRKTLLAAFRNVETLTLRPGDDWPQNFFLVASDAPLDLTGLERDGVPYVRHDSATLDAMAERVGAHVLTDDFAPVESMLAPVARIRAR